MFAPVRGDFGPCRGLLWELFLGTLTGAFHVVIVVVVVVVVVVGWY